MNAIDRARDLMIAVQFMSDKEAAIRVAAEAIRAAEADARREALEEAATLFDAASRRDTTIEIAAAVRACAMQLRALASQKGTT